MSDEFGLMNDNERKFVESYTEKVRKEERERIIALLEKYENGECGFGVTHDLVALIKGENE